MPLWLQYTLILAIPVVIPYLLIWLFRVLFQKSTARNRAQDRLMQKIEMEENLMIKASIDMNPRPDAWNSNNK